MQPFHSGQPHRLFLPFFFVFFIAAQTLQASIIYSKQTGQWSSASTWQGNVVPLSNDYVIIKSGHTVTHTGAFTRNGNLDVNGTLVLPTNVARLFTALSAVEISGELRLEGGTLGCAGQVYGEGLYRQTAGTSQFAANYSVVSTDLQGGTAMFTGDNTQFGYLVLKNATIDNAAGQGEFLIGIEFSWLDQGHVSVNTALTVQAGAYLQFAANATYSNGGLVRNRGTAHCTSGILTGGNDIFNYGIWEIDVPAGKIFTVDNAAIDNRPGGTIVKKGAGSFNFINSAGFSTFFGDNTFHVQAGTCSLIVPAFYPHNGTWQIDAGASVTFVPKANTNLVKFKGPLFTNFGEVKGAAVLQFSDDTNTALEGSGKYANVEINKTGGAEVILTGSPEIIHSFALTEGLIVLNQYDLKLGTASLSAPTTDSYIKTNGLGRCVRYCAAGSLGAFPVGKDGYAPVTIIVLAGSAPKYFRVRTADAFYGEYTANLNHLCNEQVPVGVVSRVWEVTESVAGGTTALMAAGWLEEEEENGFDRTDCTLGRYANGDWQSNGFSAAQNSSVYSQSGTTSSFGLFGVFDAGHLGDVNLITPVPTTNGPLCEWNDLFLQANTSPNAVVQWLGPDGFLSNEHNPTVPVIHAGQAGIYAVEVSQYGCASLQAAVTVQVNGAPDVFIDGPEEIHPGEPAILIASGGTTYHWNTGATAPSITVLPQQTTDYQVTVSNAAGCTAVASFTVQVAQPSAASEISDVNRQLNIAPNPTTDRVTLFFDSADDGEAEVLIFNTTGTTIRRKVPVGTGQNRTTLSLQDLPAGIYQASLIWENKCRTARIIKM